ncbi:putative formate transporter 1 [Scheffersomyces xylosifermentans]|uniref:putative formate transporter 1 n=1 Tax=Scheffersomyces xylosifermentans TaxID=1304137 RepID=UPI00315CEEA6
MDESYYLTTHETALAVVATAMKKARLRIDTLILNSIMGGILFSTGGMLYVLVGSNCYGLNESNPGIVSLIQGALYPIGLFYVVIMGVDLFNSNILFFSAALCRNAVSILDLSISWMVSYWFNLVGNIFVCYVICHYSHVSQEASFVTGSMDIVVKKASFTFVENLIKAMAGNFFVSLAIYLQLMAKPLHVKFFMMALPIFSFVSMGFTHAVADMFIIIIGLINHAPVSVAEIAWKVFLPGALGNMIGGSFFGIVITWYLHLVVVERDQRELNLPKYEVRDEQPELGMDSRVVRQKPSMEEIINDYPNIEEKLADSHESSDSNTSSDFRPQQLFGPSKQSLELKPMMSRATGATRFSTRSRVRSLKSPKNVFPVYGMGPPSKRDSIIANGRYGQEEGNIDDTDIASTYSAHIGEEEMEPRSASYIGEQLKRVVSRRKSTSTSRLRRQPSDLESQRRRLSTIIDTPIESIPNNDRSESQTPVEDYNITTYQPDSGTAEPTRGTSELHDSEPEVKPKT